MYNHCNPSAMDQLSPGAWPDSQKSQQSENKLFLEMDRQWLKGCWVDLQHSPGSQGGTKSCLLNANHISGMGEISPWNKPWFLSGACLFIELEALWYFKKAPRTFHFTNLLIHLLITEKQEQRGVNMGHSLAAGSTTQIRSVSENLQHKASSDVHWASAMAMDHCFLYWQHVFVGLQILLLRGKVGQGHSCATAALTAFIVHWNHSAVCHWVRQLLCRVYTLHTINIHVFLRWGHWLLALLAAPMTYRLLTVSFFMRLPVCKLTANLTIKDNKCLQGIWAASACCTPKLLGYRIQGVSPEMMNFQKIKDMIKIFLCLSLSVFCTVCLSRTADPLSELHHMAPLYCHVQCN